MLSLKYPKETKITGRSSTMRGAFIKAIIPTITSNKSEQEECLRRLNQNPDLLLCCYCGDKASELDHFRPIVVKKIPSGYVTDIYNLVPSCGKCNQSKSGSYWKNWMLSSTSIYSPTSRKIKDLETRIKILEDFESWSSQFVTKLPKEFLDSPVFNNYLKSCEDFLKQLEKYQIHAEEIKVELSKLK